MTFESQENAILERLREDLLAEGYDVVLRPNKLLVPPFLGKLTPDAIAFGQEKNLVIEVATQNPATERRLRELSDLLRDTPGWELRLVWISAADKPRAMRITDRDALQSAIVEVEELLGQRQAKPALLYAWATLEGIGRRLMPSEAARPQAPAKLVERLAREGFVTPAEAETLRDMISIRNRLIHGDLRTEVRRKRVAELLHILRMLLGREAGAANPDQVR